MPNWKPAPNPPSWRQLSISAWRRPQDPSVYGWMDVDVRTALRYLDVRNGRSGVKITLTHLVGKALALAIASRPDVNALICRGRLQQRESVDVFFQVAYERGENLSGAKVTGADRKSLADIADELARRAAAIRSREAHELQSSDALLSRLPGPLRAVAMRAAEALVYDFGLDLSRFGVPRDAFGSAMVTNVGVFGLPHGFAPLVPFSRVPILLTIGAVADAAVVEEGSVVVRPVLPVGATLDHRVLDGYQAGKLASRFLEVMRDPARALGE